MKPYITNLIEFSDVADKFGFKRAPHFNPGGFAFFKICGNLKAYINHVGEITFKQFRKTFYGTEIELILNPSKDEVLHMLSDIDYLIKFKEE